MNLVLLLVLLCVAFIKSSPIEAAALDRNGNIAVTVRNLSTPVQCAEDDNIYLPFFSPGLRGFRIEVDHPTYIEAVRLDRTAPDWTACDMPRDTAAAEETRQVTFYRTPELWLVGYTHPSTWLPNAVPFRVGDHVEQGLDLVQLWMATDGAPAEVLVVYPQDGYWRVRPLPPDHLGENAYGSSFLVGPVEVGARPFVALEEIAFEPERRAFRLEFARGGSALLRLDGVDRQRLWHCAVAHGEGDAGLQRSDAMAVVYLVHVHAAEHGRAVQQQQPCAARLAHRSEIGFAALDQGFERGQAVGRGSVDFRRDSLGLLFDHGAEERLLILEMMIERTARHPRRRRDVGRSGIGIAPLNEQSARGRNKVGACRLGALFVGSGHLHLYIHADCM